jgi:hypothetical protein
VTVLSLVFQVCHCVQVQLELEAGHAPLQGRTPGRPGWPQAGQWPAAPWLSSPLTCSLRLVAAGTSLRSSCEQPTSSSCEQPETPGNHDSIIIRCSRFVQPTPALRSAPGPHSRLQLLPWAAAAASLRAATADGGGGSGSVTSRQCCCLSHKPESRPGGRAPAQGPGGYNFKTKFKLSTELSVLSTMYGAYYLTCHRSPCSCPCGFM